METKKINIDCIIDSLIDISNSSPELLNEMLSDEGFNPLEVEKKGLLKIKQLLFQHRVLVKKEQQENLYAKALSLLQTANDNTKEVLLRLLTNKAPSLQFRNLEKLDVEILQQILNETELLDLMDKIEKSKSQ